MKARLNLTIDDSLLAITKDYAKRQHTSISELVESYFKTIAKPVRRKSFVDLVNELGSHDIDTNADLKKLYYNDQKHGG